MVVAAWADPVVWTVTDHPCELQEHLIRRLALPLNLDQNRHSAFHQTLSTIRAEQKAKARALPIDA
ncbi:GIY-YIG nuclease family protein [Planosporangium flavigriseum]|uniref:GIY-YIG nuclease family protein n=1 Tax=Planosporangium flavigriseum TaxID=373681 RepID=UPI0030B8130E